MNYINKYSKACHVYIYIGLGKGMKGFMSFDFVFKIIMKFVLICILLSFLNRIDGQEDDIELIAGHVVSSRISRVYISIIGEIVSDI
jgi:hypothetical protein